MRTIVTLALAFAACDPHGGSSQPDAGGAGYVCAGPYQSVACFGGTATGTIAWDRSTSRTLACPEKDKTITATCAQGCAVDVNRSSIGSGDPVVADPALLCADTPAAKVGDACGPQQPCLPTRAILAADGTVTGQTYLACGAGGTCVEAAAPTIPGYLQACDATTVATYGVADATGLVVLGDQACLIAWDAAAGAATSGVTRACVGDWECPAGGLCDDRLTRLDAQTGTIVAVCKPGPRGTLTPAMLH